MSSEVRARPGAEPSLELYLDHACPWSALAFAATRQVAASLELQPRWRLLPITGAGNAAPAEAAMHRQRRQAEWPAVLAAAADFGLALRSPAADLDGRRAAWLVAALRQELPERETELHAALFRAAFHAGRDIGQLDELRSLLGECFEDVRCRGEIERAMRGDLEADAPGSSLRAGGEEPAGTTRAGGERESRSRIESSLASDRDAASAAGVTAVPTLVLAGSHLLIGAEPPAVLEQAIEQFRCLAELAGAEPRLERVNGGLAGPPGTID